MIRCIRGGRWWPPLLFILLVLAQACRDLKPVPLTGSWFAHKSSAGYLNLERMALELRADSTYRYYLRYAPIPPLEVGEESAEGGRYSVRGDTLFFRAQVWNNRDTSYFYSRQFRLLPDTSDWPLRISMTRGSVKFEIYFQGQ